MKENILLDLVEQEKRTPEFVLESFTDEDSGWLVEVGFTTVTDANNFLISAMFERLVDCGYANRYRVVRICDNQVIYSKKSDYDCD